ncbi:MAG: DUF2157 domain-containing protein [Deltaproteobacteria bacterium]|jgi:uncharacterized membrane protein|nr:DUF2157 domain-containing protein [Deltaproteobacteria bacterium]
MAKSKLDSKLMHWEKAGLIDAAQIEKIRAYEASLPESSWVLSSLLILGTLIVGIGVISLVASNWNQIPNFVKLSVNFLVLGAIGFRIYIADQQAKPILYDSLIFGLMMMVLASIGLISQIYHTGGKLYQAILFWSLAMGPLSFMSLRPIIAKLWLGGFLTAGLWGIVDSQSLKVFFDENIYALAFTTPLLCFAGTVVSRFISQILPGQSEPGVTVALRFWTAITGLSAIGVAETVGQISRYNDKTYGFGGFVLGYALLAVSIFGILRAGTYNRIQRNLMLMMLLAFSLPFHAVSIGVRNQFAYSGMTLATLAIAGVLVATLHDKKVFQWILGLMALRFLIFYFQAIGGLATTGFGLILSGGVVIGIGLLWNKYRTAIATWAEGFAR